MQHNILGTIQFLTTGEKFNRKNKLDSKKTWKTFNDLREREPPKYPLNTLTDCCDFLIPADVLILMCINVLLMAEALEM